MLEERDPYAGWTFDEPSPPASAPQAVVPQQVVPPAPVSSGFVPAGQAPGSVTAPVTPQVTPPGQAVVPDKDPYAGWTFNSPSDPGPQQPQAQAQPQGQDPYAGWTFDGQPQAQAQAPIGAWDSLWQGAGAAIREGGQTLRGDAFTDPQQPAPEQKRTWMGDVTYGVGHSFPSLAAAVAGGSAGAAGGGAIGGPPGAVVGGLAGGGLGMGAMSFAQELAPAYTEARKEGLSHDDAVSRAYTQAAVSGVIGAATYPLFEAAPFKSLVSRFLFNTFVTMPGVGATSRVVTPAVTGQEMPSASQLGQGYLQDVVGGALIGGPVEGIRALRGGHATPMTDEEAATLEATRRQRAQERSDQDALRAGQEALAQQQQQQPPPPAEAPPPPAAGQAPAPTPIPIPEPPTVTLAPKPGETAPPRTEPPLPVPSEAPPGPVSSPQAPARTEVPPVPTGEARVPGAAGEEAVSRGAPAEPAPAPRAEPPVAELPTAAVERGTDQPPQPTGVVEQPGRPAQAEPTAEPVARAAAPVGTPAERILGIADEWAQIGNDGMAKAVRNSLNVRPNPTEENVVFQQKKLDEFKAANDPNAPKPKETYNLEGFFNSDTPREAKFWQNWKAEAPGAEDTLTKVQTAAQGLVEQMNERGLTQANAGHQGGEGGELKARLGGLLGTFKRYAATETALRKGYARGSEDKVKAARAELDKELARVSEPLRTKPAAAGAERGPVGPVEILAKLDAEKAPDEAYRAALSTSSKDPLKPGETWRSRLEKWAQEETQARAAQETKPVETKPANQNEPKPAGQDLSQVTTTSAGRKLNTEFEVHEARDLVPATGDLQPRANRENAQQSVLQRQEIRTKLDPERLHASPEADRGSPIIDENKTLLAGNNRTAAIRELHQSTEPGDQARAQAYREMIQRETGVDTTATGMKEPVLVRRITDPLSQEDKVAVARESNVAATQRMGEVEQAKIDAKSLTPESLDKFRAEQDLTSAGNREFVKDFVKSVPTSEHNEILDSNTGALSQAGQRRLRAAVMARAYGDEGILSRGLESTHDETRAITSGLMEASQSIAKVRSLIEQGKLDPKFDLSQDIARAADLVRQAREQGKSMSDIIQQGDMFGGNKLPPVQEALVRAFYTPNGERAASRTAIGNLLKDYARLAQEQGKDMLGDLGKQAPEKVLNQLVEARGRKAEQGRLVADTTDTTGEDSKQRGKKAPFTEALPGRKLGFEDYKLRDGTSVYEQIFSDAGHKPELAVNYPIAKQNEIIKGQVQKQLGFSHIEIESKADPKEVRDQLMDVYRAGHDLTNALDLPTTAVSNNGKLALRMENKGRGYYGAYDPNEVRIGLVGKSQSYFHEFAHALSHHLSDVLNSNPNKKGFLTEQLRDREYVPTGQPGHDQVVEAYARLLNTVFYDEGALASRMIALDRTATRTDAAGNPTKAALEAQRQLEALKLGGSKLRIQPSEYRSRALSGPNPSYWASAEELVARAFESYIARKAQLNGVDPRGIAMQEEAFNLMHDPRIARTFPHETERVRVYDAIDRIFNAIRDTELLGKGRGARSTDMGITDPRTWGKSGPQDATGLELTKRTREFKAQWAERRERYKEPLFTDPTRPTGNEQYTWKHRMGDYFAEHIGSSIWMMERIRDRTPESLKGQVQGLIDAIAPSPGSGRYTAMSFEQKSRQRGRQTISQYIGALKEHGIRSLSREQGDMLRHVLTTGEDTFPTNPLRDNSPREPIPKNIQQAAGKIRLILNEEYEYNRKVGIDVGYAKSGFFPRIYDDIKIMSDQKGFTRAATKLHKDIFDDHIAGAKEPGQTFLDYWNDLGADARSRAPGDMQDDMKSLKTLLKQHEAATAANDQVRINDINDQIQAVIDQHQDTLGNIHADLAAKDWHGRVSKGHATDYETRGPSSAYTRGRKLPPEADRIMRDYMISNPDEAITMYLHQSSQRGAAAEKFGANFQKLDDAIDALYQGGMHGEDLHRLRDLVEQVTGKASRTGWSRGVLRATNRAVALAQIGLLPRTAWTTVQEPLTVALTTGDFKASFHAFAGQFKALWDATGARERAEAMDLIGITTSIQHENILASRTMDYRENPNLAKVMSHFYRMTGLTQITQAQRRSMGAAGTYLLRKWANQAATELGPNPSRRALNAQDNARGWLRESGIDDKHHTDFREWINSFEGLPKMDDIKTRNPMRELYNEAIYRFVDQHIQEPLRATKPILSNNPFGRFVFSLMAFNYSYQRNVLEPAMHRVSHAYNREVERGLEAGNSRASRNARALVAATHAGMSVGTGAAAITGAGLVTQTAYEYLYNRDAWDKHSKDGTLAEWLIDRAVSVSGLQGTLDPLVQIYNNSRRDTDFTKLFLGAPGTYLASNLQDLVAPYVSGSGKDQTSNLQTRNQVLAAHRLLMSPAMMLGLTKATSMFPGGVVNPAAAIAAWYVSSASAANRLADAAAGKPGTTLPKPGEGLGSLGGMGEGDLGMDAKPHGQKQEGGSVASKVVAGLADDVVAPLLRVAPPIVKSAGVGGLGLYAGWDWWNRSSKFRNAPPPKEK